MRVQMHHGAQCAGASLPRCNAVSLLPPPPSHLCTLLLLLLPPQPHPPEGAGVLVHVIRWGCDRLPVAGGVPLGACRNVAVKVEQDEFAGARAGVQAQHARERE